MGTVRYMSPEQVRGQEVDLRTDLYSLGATMYESLVGDTPFDGSTHFEIMTKHLSELPKPPSVHGIELPRDVEDAIMRSLAKKAPDRFETARDFRKILENALKDGDVGFVETQRISRQQVLGDLKATKDEKASAPTPPLSSTPLPEKSPRALAPTTRAATANDLADELEPGTTSAKVTKGKSSKLPWVILVALVVVGGGATAAVMAFGGKSGTTYQPQTRIKGVTLTQGKKVGTVFVETTAKLSPEEVEVTYEAVLQDIKDFEPKLGGKRDLVEEIVALPQTHLCSPGIVRASQKACNASDTVATALHGEKRQLLISDDRATLADNMRVGVAHAVCDFQLLLPENDSGTPEVVKKLDAICEMTKRFATPK
jgi:hypothetical protein